MKWARDNLAADQASAEAWKKEQEEKTGGKHASKHGGKIVWPRCARTFVKKCCSSVEFSSCKIASPAVTIDAEKTDAVRGFKIRSQLVLSDASGARLLFACGQTRG